MSISPSTISFILRAKNRKAILMLLEKGPKLPAQLMKESGMYKGHTSRAIKELKDKDMVHCTNPNDRTYRFYALTPGGKKALNEIKKILKNI